MGRRTYLALLQIKMPLPITTKIWAVCGTGPGAGTSALEFKQDEKIPELNPNDVLVNVRAGSLNYRDIASK